MRDLWARGFWWMVLVLAGFALLSLTRYMSQVRRLERLYRVVATQHAQLQATRDALAAQLTATPDPQTLERFWRERTGQVKPGEQPVRIVPQGTPAARGVPPLRLPTPEPPWRAWWRLFFGP